MCICVRKRCEKRELTAKFIHVGENRDTHEYILPVSSSH